MHQCVGQEMKTKKETVSSRECVVNADTSQMEQKMNTTTATIDVAADNAQNIDDVFIVNIVHHENDILSSETQTQRLEGCKNTTPTLMHPHFLSVSRLAHASIDYFFFIFYRSLFSFVCCLVNNSLKVLERLDLRT